MSDCERYEILVSSWLDAQLERADQIEMLDHLVRCARCREFYLSGRALSGLLAAAGSEALAEQPSPHVWERIERSSEERASERRGGWAWARARQFQMGALTAAAAVLVVLGVLVTRPERPASVAPEPAGIRLGEDAGRMSDARFVELTAEVLRADRRYREAFYEVMRQVERDTSDDESSVDLHRPAEDVREERPAPETTRGRS
jgi:hypothetical protein